jgi:glycosyltransferase involved in cell wall biosynthesis
MIKAPKVSVIMNCYNSETYLHEAIESVYNQSFVDWEIIFFDNDSSDSSASIALSYDNKIKYFKNNKTVLLGEARNLAIGKAKGEYVAFLDCDDVWLPEKLKLQLEQLEKPSEREIGFCYSNAMRIDSSGKDILSYSHEKKLYSGNVYQELIYSSFIACSACMVKKEVFEKIGWFNPKFHHVEEWDLWLRIAKKYDLAFVDKELANIRVHVKNISRNIEEQYIEKIQLAKMIIERDSSYSSDCHRSIKISSLQFQISKLLLTSNKKEFAIQLFSLAVSILTRPIIAIIVLRRLLNLNLYKAFKIKYLSPDSNSV